MPSRSQYNAYHFDIGQVENPDALDLFIFELLILRCVVSGTCITHMRDQSVVRRDREYVTAFVT